jgi:hypothetical protein
MALGCRVDAVSEPTAGFARTHACLSRIHASHALLPRVCTCSPVKPHATAACACRTAAGASVKESSGRTSLDSSTQLRARCTDHLAPLGDTTPATAAPHVLSSDAPSRTHSRARKPPRRDRGLETNPDRRRAPRRAASRAADATAHTRACGQRQAEQRRYNRPSARVSGRAGGRAGAFACARLPGCTCSHGQRVPAVGSRTDEARWHSTRVTHGRRGAAGAWGEGEGVGAATR